MGRRISCRGRFGLLGVVADDAGATRLSSRGCRDRALTAFREILANRFGVNPRRIHVIPGGVEADRFAHATPRANAERCSGWPQDRPVVLCVRRLVRRVGVDTLVEAAVNIRRRVPDALILIAGTGPLRDELAGRIAALGFEEPFGSSASCATRPSAGVPRGKPHRRPHRFARGLRSHYHRVSRMRARHASSRRSADSVKSSRQLAPQLVMRSSSASDIADAISRALLGELPLPSSESCADYARAHFDWPVIARRVRDVYASTT